MPAIIPTTAPTGPNSKAAPAATIKPEATLTPIFATAPHPLDETVAAWYTQFPAFEHTL